MKQTELTFWITEVHHSREDLSDEGDCGRHPTLALMTD
jgi:hypothetical protein